MINFEKHILPNGMTVYLAPMHETQAVTIMFQFKVGSRHELDTESGLSHFLEHMFFKGTKKRPTTLDISQELDALGAEYNAFTSEERTSYFVSAAAEHFPIAFDVLTDMLYNSTFDGAEIEKEKGVICEEIKMYRDNPTSYLNEVAKNLIYGDTPLGRDIAGSESSVRKFTQADFLTYKGLFYGPNNTTLIIAGNPAGNDWLKTVLGELSHLPQQQPRDFMSQNAVPETAVAIGHKPIDQAHFWLSHYALPHTDAQLPQLEVLSNILGGTMSSRLFVEVREKRGLAYYVRSGVDSFHDIGTFDCGAGVDAQKVAESVSVVLDEIKKMKESPVTDIELTRAKQNIKGRLSLRLEDSYSIARYISSDDLERGKVEQPEAYIEKIEKVTQDDIVAIANELLVPEKRKLAVVGPLEQSQTEKLTELLKKG
jgi:predicted Zn-dependent peptidase